MKETKIRDYHCKPEADQLLDTASMERLGLSYPDVYFHQDSMVKLARAYQEREKTPYCVLPFCHTLEAEAMGAKIQFGDDNFGPRAGDFCCESLQQVLELPEIDLNRGRVAEVLGACQKLHQEKIPVVLQVSGPFTILGSLMDLSILFREMKKEPQLWNQVLARLKRELLAYCQRAVDLGVDMISYGDSAGSVGIIGSPKAEQIVEDFTAPFLYGLEEITCGKALIILCPKTTFALTGTDKAEFIEMEIPENLSYQEACTLLGPRLNMVGQTCLKQNLQLHGRIKRIGKTGNL